MSSFFFYAGFNNWRTSRPVVALHAIIIKKGGLAWCRQIVKGALMT